MNNLVSIIGLKKYFLIKSDSLFGKKRWNKAVDDINLEIEDGEALGIVGESGSGKTTLGKLILGLLTPSSGKVEYSGKHKNAPNLSVVFQDPFSSLNPRMTVFNIVKEPLLKQYGKQKDFNYRELILKTLNMVGLSEEQMFRYPHEFSGGQRQRIAIARAVISNPLFIVFDEPTSGLDVSVQAQILNLLKDMKSEYKLSYIFISHNLGVIKYISNRIVVMYCGKVVEIAENNELFNNPRHPYTKKLLAAVPVIDEFHKTSIDESVIVDGELKEISETGAAVDGSSSDSFSGCIYYDKCPIRADSCKKQAPDGTTLSETHTVYCWQHDAE